jgi:catechol 1,2-dioxygenase
MNFSRFLLVCILVAGRSACGSATLAFETESPTQIIIPTSSPMPDCTPTNDDGVSPTYQPDMPVRSTTGHGHVLTGIVLSSTDCQPIPNAKLEFWPEEAGLGHPDSSRATLFTDSNGQYHFECNPPEHIHMRISAEGFHTIGVNSYHPEGAAEGIMNFVLVAEN